MNCLSVSCCPCVSLLHFSFFVSATTSPFDPPPPNAEDGCWVGPPLRMGAGLHLVWTAVIVYTTHAYFFFNTAVCCRVQHLISLFSFSFTSYVA